uniref:Uncharacterized protein n=1 Tax=Arabidopsis thaliana TaxID=3702 RepID=Q0WW05_ARATH|nr:hypothetical protein [Arabidopsis thaliana]
MMRIVLLSSDSHDEYIPPTHSECLFLISYHETSLSL